MLTEMCLQLTNTCPMRCMHCSTRAGHPIPVELSTSEHLRLISDFAAYGGRVIEFSGGEPLVSPDLESLVRFASGAGLEVRLYTSGVVGFEGRTALAEARDRWRRLKNAGLRRVYFNLQGEAPEVHERISRLPGSFDAVVSGIKNAKAAGLYVGIHFVPMKPNYQRVRFTAALSTSLGADEFAVLRFVPQGRGLDHRSELELGQVEFFWLLSEISELQRAIPTTEIRIGCPFNYRFLVESAGSVPSCKAGDAVIHVRPNGDVVPCSGFQQNAAVLGNVRFSSLEQLWSESPKWSRFRALREDGPAPGSIPFIERHGEACLAQIAMSSQQDARAFMSKAGLQTDSGTPERREAERPPEVETSP